MNGSLKSKIEKLEEIAKARKFDEEMVEIDLGAILDKVYGHGPDPGRPPNILRWPRSEWEELDRILTIVYGSESQ
jgi:hypothetical protein